MAHNDTDPKPTPADELRRMAEQMTAEGKPVKALDLWGLYLAESPRDAYAAHVQRGKLQAQTRRFREALASFGRAAALGYDGADLHYEAGVVHRELGDLNSALGEFRSATEGSTPMASAYLSTGQIQAKQGLHEEAIGQYDRAIAIDPTLTVAELEASTSLEALGRTDEALARLRRAWADTLVIPQVYEALGTHLLHLRDRTAKLTELEREFAERVADRADAACSILEGWASILATLGHHDRAIACYRRALETDLPDFETLVSLYDQGDHPVPGQNSI